jgi:uncharacterized RDD family membrane protein YckC
MDWYYNKNGSAEGPISESDILKLHSNGEITLDTLVWNETLTDWVPYESSGLSSATKLQPQNSQRSGPDQIACPNCGASTTSDNLAQMGDIQVCPACKEETVQKFKEGGSLGKTSFEYAGFWIRFVAAFIDGIILGIVNIGFSIAGGIFVGMSAGSSITGDVETMGDTSPFGIAMFVILSYIIPMAIGIWYYTYFTGSPKHQATLGKKAVGLKVIRSNGEALTYKRAAGRYFATWLSSMILGIGYLMVVWNKEKEALHDLICDTRVVKK